MRKFYSLLCLISFSLLLEAQQGASLLTHFRVNREIENQSWAICQDRSKVMLFANRKGILSFDGEEWSPLRIQITPFSMEMNPYDRRIYVGGENNYGFIERDARGIYRYKSLSGNSADVGLITRIIFSDSIACFYGEKSISCYNFNSGRLTHRFHSEEDSPFTGMFMNSKNIFINVSGKGLHRVESDTLFPIVTGYLTRQEEILFSLPYNNEKVLVGLGNSKISLFDGIKYYDFQIKDDGYISGNVLSGGIAVGDSLYAFSTLGGGAVVIEKKTGIVKFTINNLKGLPDDEVFALGSDESGGLWISHPFGLTRADLNLPVENFSIYPGLKGNLASSLRHNNELYVATSEGVFYLTYEKNYAEIEVPGKTSIMQDASLGNLPVNLVSPPAAENKLQVMPDTRNTRKGLFTRIFGKKSEASVTEADQAPDQVRTQGKSSVKTIAPQTTIKKIRRLKSIDYVYKKIPGLNDKCRQLVPTEHGILAATNRGLFIISNHKAAPLADNRYINFISWQPESGTYSVAASDGYFFAGYNNGKWYTEIPDKQFSDPVYSILHTEKNTVWLGGDNIAYRGVSVNGTVEYRKFRTENSYSQRYFMSGYNDTIFLLTETGVSYYDEASAKFNSYDLKQISIQADGLRYPLSNIPLIGSGNSWMYADRKKVINDHELCLVKLFDDVVSVNIEKENIWIIDGENQIYGINRLKSSKMTSSTDLMIKNIRNSKGTSFDLSNIVFDRGDNIIDFDIVAPAYLKKNLTQYQYFVTKVMNDWSSWSDQTTYSQGISKPGEYTLLVRAKNMWGEVGNPVSIMFTIKAPFTRTALFYLLVVIFSLMTFILIVRFREKALQEKNRVLEEKIKERTAEIEAQKEEITSSIEYASRIQMAMLPVSNLFTDSFSDYFIVFKPRDIVSGDFYWIGEAEKHVFLTVADCTGHGVPGAFMSALGISILNEIISQNHHIQANKVLNLLREKIKTSLHQTGKEGEAADGMDISLCVYDRNRRVLQYSGAYNPLFLFTEGDLREFKADRMPIGIHYGDEASFTNYEINVKKGDILYLLSDGLTDQFGGPEGSKFKKAHLKKLLYDIHQRPMSEQKKQIESEFLSWKGRNEQVDDITVIGVRI